MPIPLYHGPPRSRFEDQDRRGEAHGQGEAELRQGIPPAEGQAAEDERRRKGRGGRQQDERGGEIIRKSH